MPDIADAVLREIQAIQALADKAADDDQAGILQALDRITGLHEAVRDAQQYVADIGPPTVMRALHAGVDQADLYGRPYVDSKVRAMARGAGLPPKKRGPKRRPVPPLEQPPTT